MKELNRKIKNFRIAAVANFTFATAAIVFLCGFASTATGFSVSNLPPSAAESSASLEGSAGVIAESANGINPEAAFAPREVRVVTQNTTAGSTITVVLQADTMGDESIYGFSLNYTPSVLTFVPGSVMIGSGATRQAGGMCSVLENANMTGSIGFSVDCNNSTITAGNNRPFVTLQFTVNSNAAAGSTALTFGDTPTRRSVASNPAAGPIQRLATTFTDGNVNIGTTRVVRVVNQNSSGGSTVTVVIQTDAVGDESIYGFSLNYTPSVLTFVPGSVMIGSGATRQAGGMCSVLANPTAGSIGFSVDCNNSTITAGNNRPFVTLQFTVNSNAAAGSTGLTFGDTPTARSVSSNPAVGAVQNLPTSFANGTVTIAGPTAAPVSVSGRLVSASGAGIGRATVKLFDTASGQTYNALTGADGAYVFEGVAVGGDYIVTPAALGYTFNPKSKFFSLVEDLTAVDFVGVRGRKRNL